jgi:hypothetical protein
VNGRKDLQATRIRALADALAAEGIRGLDEQAKALGLGRSTAWTVLRGNHKASGRTIRRMLAAPSLPSSVRAILLEYMEEKAAGLYGDSKRQIGQFVTRVAQVVGRVRAPEQGNK